LLPEDPRGLPVGRLARRLLAEAEACPALIGRTKSRAAVAKAPLAEPFSAMALLSDPAVDIRQYLEDLVSIAVSSAQQAEDVSFQAQVASKRARRGMAVVASLGALGLVVGIAGFAASRSSNIALSEVREEVTALQDMQHQAHDQLAEIASQTSEQRDTADTTRQAVIAPAAMVSQPLPTASAQPPSARYSEPWPDSRPPQRHIAVVDNRPVVVPAFLANIQRNLYTIFR
jgi:hypothetical protein